MDPVSFVFWRFYYFFRDPSRLVPAGRSIVSPADGRVLYLKDVPAGDRPTPVKEGMPVSLEEWQQPHGIWARGGTLVGIYMTPISVHYNRAPIAGRVKTVLPRPAEGENLSMGKTLARLVWNYPPYDEDSAYITRNARNTVVIEGDFPVAVVQIADRWIRKIDCYVTPGQRLEKGQKYGMIRMGSQCDLFIPAEARAQILCRPGDKVLAGETILATY